MAVDGGLSPRLLFQRGGGCPLTDELGPSLDPRRNRCTVAAGGVAMAGYRHRTGSVRTRAAHRGSARGAFMSTQCLWPIFTETESTCSFLGLNRDVWLNVTTELAVGVLFGGFVLALFVRWIGGMRIAAQWKAARASRLTVLLRDVGQLGQDVAYTAMALASYAEDKTALTRAGLQEMTRDGRTTVRNIRHWMSLATLIFPSGLLRRLAAIETQFLAVERFADICFSDAEFIADHVTAGEHEAGQCDIFRRRTGEFFAAIEALLTLVGDGLVRHVPEVREEFEKVLAGRANAAREIGRALDRLDNTVPASPDTDAPRVTHAAQPPAQGPAVKRVRQHAVRRVTPGPSLRHNALSGL